MVAGLARRFAVVGPTLALLVASACSSDSGEPNPLAPTLTAAPSPTATETRTPVATGTPTPQQTPNSPEPTEEARGIVGIFTDPRERTAGAVRDVGPRPPSPFKPWNLENVVLYDFEPMTEHDLGPGAFARFSPDGKRLAWAAGAGGQWDELRVLDLATGEERALGPGRALRWVDDETLVVYLPGTSNTLEVVDVATGGRRPSNGVNLNPVYQPIEVGGWRLDQIEQGDYPIWETTYELTDVSGAHLPLRFDAFRAVLAPDGALFIVAVPEQRSDPPARGPDVRTGRSNIFEVDPETGEATYVATADVTAPGWPVVASEDIVAWSNDPCGLSGEPHGVVVLGRESGSITELLPGGWVSAARGRVIGLDVFGPRALIDALSLEYLAVLPESTVDVQWTASLRYAAVGAALGHGGPC